ncbi:hypothetical protein LOK49_LG06G00228 [Camellia lanceoleosa]|uniref:Uncharacterized protein n=1 Tax=Camellia lanceoleosa TaxID=1840588 RepID=A0ACC0HE54_9ERIC|nr:hypothetical protein LOK49_LG06G00228 [Camellia lanceoleosa]
MTSISIAWQRPPAGWVKVNVDGATTKRSGHAVYGGLIRSAQGTWISDSSMRWKFLLFMLPNCGQIWREANGCVELFAKKDLGMNVLNEVIVVEPAALAAALEFDLRETGSSWHVQV